MVDGWCVDGLVGGGYVWYNTYIVLRKLYRIPRISGFVPLNAGYTVSVRRTRLDVLILLTLALISRGVTDMYPSRGYTHPVTRAIEVSHAACKAEFGQKSFLDDLTHTAQVHFFTFFNAWASLFVPAGGGPVIYLIIFSTFSITFICFSTLCWWVLAYYGWRSLRKNQ